MDQEVLAAEVLVEGVLAVLLDESEVLAFFAESAPDEDSLGRLEVVPLRESLR